MARTAPLMTKNRATADKPRSIKPSGASTSAGWLRKSM
jgi:hypothetical protein